MMGCATEVKEVNYRGSRDEVLEDLYGVFPVGTHKTEVVSRARSVLGLDDSAFIGSTDNTGPFVFRIGLHEGQEPTTVHSEIRLLLSVYRSFDVLFLKVYVSARIFFDDDDRLKIIVVSTDVDSL